MLTLLCTILLAFISITGAQSDNHGYRYLHPGTVVMGGYYGMPPLKYPRPSHENDNYIPSPNENRFETEKEPIPESVLIASDEEKDVLERTTIPTPTNIDKALKPKETVVTKKVFPKKTNNNPDEDEPLNTNFPFGSRGSTFYNTFFPIMMGGNSGVGRKSGAEDGFEGGATAIANSFSTGRGGVASSHATSFGDVHFKSDMRNENERIREGK